MKFIITMLLLFSPYTLGKVCNQNGKCWDNKTITQINNSFCKSIGKNRSEIDRIDKNIFRTLDFDLKRNYDLINCYKKSNPLNISQTIIMRDLWPGHLTPYLCYASRSTNLSDLNWIKKGIKKRRYHWTKYLKSYEFALKKKIEFAKFCNGSAPFGVNFRNRNRLRSRP